MITTTFDNISQITGLEHKDDLANEYLGSFKVARFETQDLESSDDDAEAEKAEEAPQEDPEDDPDYWRKLLGATYETEQVCGFEIFSLK